MLALRHRECERARPDAGRPLAVTGPARWRAFVSELAAARVGGTFNQYAEGLRAPLLRERLAAYLEARAGADLLLVGEAPGYRGARVSGIPFTSERQLTGAGAAEATATLVHRALDALGLQDRVLLWNAVPTHPGGETWNRPPTRAEVEAARPFLDALAAGRTVIAVGRIAAAATGAPYVRHPSRGGGGAFAEGLARRVAVVSGVEPLFDRWDGGRRPASLGR